MTWVARTANDKVGAVVNELSIQSHDLKGRLYLRRSKEGSLKLADRGSHKLFDRAEILASRKSQVKARNLSILLVPVSVWVGNERRS